MENIIDGIKAEMEKTVPNVQEQSSGKTNIFTIKTANEVIEEASKRPDPQPLFDPFWNEGELCCLFADSNVGKSILAVQIGQNIAATGKKIAYVDCELSNKQFQKRYTSNDGNKFRFSENLYRVYIDLENLINAELSEEYFLSQIEKTLLDNSIKVLIIDNITWLCNNSEKGEDAGKFMQRLMKLKLQYEWSILILAHTPKRPLSNPITQNDLAGSKKLFNFFDSAFSIGKSCQGIDVRYIKQLKVRDGIEQYGANNVMVCRIVKTDSYLHFEKTGESDERDHLKGSSQSNNSEMKNNVKELHEEGKSIREIAEETGISKSTVGRWVKNDFF